MKINTALVPRFDCGNSNAGRRLECESTRYWREFKERGLDAIAQQRKQSLAQMALAWLLKDRRITSVLIGASSVQQLDNNIDMLGNIDFAADELKDIEKILTS